MTKEGKKALIASTLVCLIPLVAGALLYSRLPEQVVTHWDAAGNPDGWSSRFVGVFVLPGILLLLNLLFPLILKMDPRYRNISEKTKLLIQWILPAVGLFAAGSTLANALGADVKIPLLATLFMGLVFVVIGNYLPKMARSYTVGIKLPWTLDDEENWDKTHRLAGFLWVICGILMIASAFLPCRFTVFIILLAVATLVPTVYSFVLFLKKKQG